MASAYFTLPSFARAKKNQEDLQKTNPQQQVLRDEDEKFLEKEMSRDEVAGKQQGDSDVATQITDDGEVKEVEKTEEGGAAIVPETQPEGVKEAVEEGKDVTSSETGELEAKDGDAEAKEVPMTDEGGQEATDGAAETPSYDDALKDKAAEAKQARKAKKDRGFDLPTQEEAEAATRGMNSNVDQQDQDTSQGEKRTWASYLPTVRPSSRKTDDPSQADEKTPDSGSKDADQRTWTQYATSIVPTTWPTLKRNPDPDSQPSPVYNEDGTLNEEATQQKQEQEISVLLDNLSLSSINNRVFPLTQETQKYYERFAQCLKDIINGAPTAYEDMDKLMREAGPKLEKQFSSMPPFVQTLVKTLPAKIGGSLGPEVLAAVASEKPGEDMKRRMEAASRPGPADSGITIPSSSTEKKAEDGAEGDKKKKSRIPGLKSLVGEKSAVAGMLRSVVTFLQTRFPFLASMTNVVMSLAVFSKLVKDADAES